MRRGSSRAGQGPQGAATLTKVAFLVLAAAFAESSFAGEGVAYTMRDGDTLWALSRRHGVSIAALTRVNQIEHPRRIPVGLRIVIPSQAFQRIDALLGKGTAELRRARFDEARDTIERARTALEAKEATPDALTRRAEIELLTATVDLAFGEIEAARGHLAAALETNPDLDLIPALSSPKLARLLWEVSKSDGVSRRNMETTR